MLILSSHLMFVLRLIDRGVCGVDAPALRLYGGIARARRPTGNYASIRIGSGICDTQASQRGGWKRTGRRGRAGGREERLHRGPEPSQQKQEP